MEHLWSRADANSGNRRQRRGPRNPLNYCEPLQRVATVCYRANMVWRGSTVRVRQRACMKCVQIFICCLLFMQHAGSPRLHLRKRDACRSFATPRDTLIERCRRAFFDDVDFATPEDRLLGSPTGVEVDPPRVAREDALPL